MTNNPIDAIKNLDRNLEQLIDEDGNLKVSGSGGSGGTVSVYAVYNASPPNLADGEQTPLQADSSGKLLVSGLGGGGGGSFTGSYNSGVVDSTTLRTVTASNSPDATSLASIDSKIPSSLTVSATRLLVDASGTTQPISATSLPLPTGASTAANQSTANTSLASIDSKTPALGQALANGSVPVVLTAAQISAITPLSSVSISNLPATQAISAASLPLPSGAATASNQSTGNTSLSNIDSKIPVLGQALASSSVPVVLTSSQLATLTPLTSVSINNLPATQPVSASSLPLPTGASTESTLSSLNSKLVTSSTNPTGTETAPIFRCIPSGTQTISGNVSASQSGTWSITNISGTISLPTGAATASNQSTGNTSLSSIDGKLPALGQALAAASVPVVLTASQLATLTPLSSVSVSNFPASQTVSGTVAATQSGNWNITNISGTIALPTGAATSAKQPTLGTAGTSSSDVLTVQGIAGMTAIKIDGSAVTQPVSASSLPLPSGAATSANQSTANTSLASIDSKIPALGQALAANSTPVVLTASQLSTLTPLSTISATQSGTWNLNNISGTISLPTGAATSTKQPALGTAGTASSDVITVQGIASMVALKTDGSAVTQPISATSLPLPSGAATATNQNTGNTSLANIDSKIPSLGQALAAASVPVVLTASQLSTLTPLSTVAVTQSGTWNLNNISGTIALPTGAATASNQTSGNASLSSVDSKLPTLSADGANRLYVCNAETPTEFSVSNRTTTGDYFSTDVTGYSQLSLILNFTSLTATFVFEASNDGSNWANLKSRLLINPSSSDTTYLTGNLVASNSSGSYILVLPIYTKYVRMRLVSYTSGSVTGNGILYRLVKDTSAVDITGSKLIIADGASSSISVSVKDSSTSPTATDKALVVANRPNSLTPTIASVTLTNADTEYTYTFTSVRAYSFKVLTGGGTVRFAWTAGLVASSTLPYYTCDSSNEETQQFTNNNTLTATIRFASSVANTKVLIQQWT